MCMQRQKGWRAAYFGDTVLLVPEKIAKIAKKIAKIAKKSPNW